MSSVEDHYDRHLGPVYSWMLGGAEAALSNARAELRESGLCETSGGVAVDLGAGTGAHSIALTELGYSVIALDSCDALLGELRREAGSRPIATLRCDLVAFPKHCPARVDAILCMGDTLTHLPSLEAVHELFRNVRATLAPGGRFLATFRDYVGAALQGTARFIPVRSDETRILTCFLEYLEHTVVVHDLLHVRGESGWVTTVSAYPKLRLDPQRARQALSDLGLHAVLERAASGMVRLEAISGMP